MSGEASDQFYDQWKRHVGSGVTIAEAARRTLKSGIPLSPRMTAYLLRIAVPPSERSSGGDAS